MRNKKQINSSRVSKNQPNHRRGTNSVIFRAAVIAGLFAMALTALLVTRPAATTVQAQKSFEVPASASLVEATEALAGQTTKPVTTEELNLQAVSGDPAIPIGSVCGWSSSTVSPAPVLDQATTVVGGNLYSFGGVSNGAIVATSNKFDGAVWTSIAPLPAALEFPTAVTNGTDIYILGGALVGTGTPQTTLYRYNVAMNTYTPLASFTVGTWNAAAVYLSGKIYKFAGTGPATNSTNALEIYDIAGNSWTTGAVYPISSSFVGAFTDGTFIYGAGGITAPGSIAQLKTYRYDPGTNMWDDAAIADLPQTRWGAASSIVGYGVNSGFVMAGGYVNGTATANISPTVVRWSPTGNTWDPLPNMVGGVARMTGGVLGNSFHVVGGRSIASSGFVGTNGNQKLDCISGVAVITPGTATITAEGNPPPNNAPDPGELVTVNLPLSNTGDTATTNLTATLQATGGVTNPSAPQNYGVLAPMGSAVNRSFSFTVDPMAICGTQITLTWTISDGATNYPNYVQQFTLGTPNGIVENFDGVTAPALPMGWVTNQAGTGPNLWTTTTTGPDTAPNSAFTNDPATLGEASLETPVIPISSPTTSATFNLKYVTESTFDGMVLEIKIGAGAWEDILTAGGSFNSNGYNSTISTGFMSPIGGRMAWSGNSVNYLPVSVNLPASANGQNIQLRFRMATDTSVASTGVNVDTFTLINGYSCTAPPVGSARADFDGDGKTDLSVFRPSEGNWYINGSTVGFSAMNFGLMSDKIVPGDYDGDGKTDMAVFRPVDAPGTPDFYVLNSNGFVLSGQEWGLVGDIPVTEDYDNDGKTDVAVYRPSTGTWYILRSSGGIIVQPYGLMGDIPVAGDFIGDGAADLTVFRPSNGTWYTKMPVGDAIRVFGLGTDKLVPADYDGDGKDDLAVFRPSNGTWYIYNSGSGMEAQTQFGLGTDIPVPGDYDGDGKYDIGVYRNGEWYVKQSMSGSTVVSNFGLGSDTAIPVRYLPDMGGGSAVTVSYTGPVVAIPDNTPAGTNIMVPVSGVGTIADLNFRFDGTVASADPASTTVGVNHSWIGDLIFKVTSPMGTTVTVFDRPGVPVSTVGCSNNNLFQTTLNDDGGLPAVEIQGNPSSPGCNTALAFPVGNFSPNNPLSAFDGQNADGMWVINVSDNAGSDTGSVRAFSLVFNSGN